MARLLEFDRSEVLQAALDVFWRDGYESTTIQKLTTAMALNRGSLYGTFVDKESLFLEVMDCYGRYQTKIMRSNLSGLNEPLEAIRSFLEYFALHEAPDIRERGCLLFNTISELSHTRPELAHEAWRRVGYLRKLFIKRLEQAASEGVIREDKALNDLADYLVAFASGLRTHCKAKTDPMVIQEVINVGLEGLVRRA